MLKGKGVIQETDMPLMMQVEAMSCASEALDLFDVYDYKCIATHIKKEFDKIHGSGWQCIVGANFGCFITHCQGTFIYFCIESLYFLLFKVVEPSQLLTPISKQPFATTSQSPRDERPLDDGYRD